MQVKIDWQVFLWTSFVENWNIAPLTIVFVLGFPVIRSKLQNGRASASALSSVAGIVAPAYPHGLITRARLGAEEKQRADLLVTIPGSNCTAADRPPLVITYHPKNIAVCNILLRNCTLLRDDESTKATFHRLPLKAFCRTKNQKDLLVHSSLPQVLQRQIGTSPCHRRNCRTCSFINSPDRITTTQRQIKISGVFTCITSQLIYWISCRRCPRVVYIGETGRRLGDRFREHRLDVICALFTNMRTLKFKSRLHNCVFPCRQS